MWYAILQRIYSWLHTWFCNRSNIVNERTKLELDTKHITIQTQVNLLLIIKKIN